MEKFPVVRKKISEKIYKEIHRNLPIVCVDLVVTDGKKFFLAKRTNEPEKGKWWFLGGRVLKNEKLKEAVIRSLKREMGIGGKIEKFLGFHEFFLAKGYFPGMNSHMVPFLFRIKVDGKKGFRLDQQSSAGKWFSKIDPKWHPYLKKFLREAGFR